MKEAMNKAGIVSQGSVTGRYTPGEHKQQEGRAKRAKDYWGLMNGSKVLFKGTHGECWKTLVSTLGDKTVKQLSDEGIAIRRIG